MDHYTQFVYQISKIITIKEYTEMKKGLHPENYRPVVFKDMSNGDVFLSRSTCSTKETIEFEGETRSEERRVGKECRIGCRSRWSPYH